MIATYLSPLISLLLIVAFIADRIFRLRSIKEYRDAKEAQIALLQQQLEMERSNNDVRLAEMHKARYESLKLLLDEKELEISQGQEALLELQTALQDKAENQKLLNKVIAELNRMDKSMMSVELKRKMFLHQLKLKN